MTGKEGVWDLGDDEFALFAGLIEKSSGLYFDESKKDSLRISLTTRISLTRHKSFIDYYEFLKDPLRGAEEFKKLLSLITINETYFFRNPEQYAILRRHILPAIIRQKTQARGTPPTLRIWSAGCSTGEEPYTLAIVLKEMEDLFQGWTVEILATDVSEKALETAKNGIYGRRSLQNMTQSRIDRYFVRDGERYTIIDDIKKIVRFAYFNLIHIPYPLYQMQGKDIIFCKNVTIYFKIESTKRVINNFCDSLNSGGYLFIGHSETLWGVSDRFETVVIDGVFCYQKGGCERATTTPGHGSAQKKISAHPDKPHLSPMPKVSTPQPSEDLYIECERLYYDGRYAEAETRLVTILNETPEHLKARLLMAYLHANQEDHAGAEKECLEIVRIDTTAPVAAEAYLLLGTVYGKLQRQDEALNALKKALYVNPALVEAYIQLAGIYKNMGQWSHALLAFENAVKYMEGAGGSVVHGPERQVSQKILLDLCRGNIEILKTRV